MEILDEDNWFIDVKKLRIGSELGSGAFGRVYKAQYLGTTVCVKQIVNAAVTGTPKDEFEHEVKMLK